MACAGRRLNKEEATAFRAGLQFGLMTEADLAAASHFGSGQKEVDDFLRDQAVAAASNDWTKTWVFHHDGEIVGYVSLAFCSIEMGLAELGARGQPARPATWPGLLIGMLGVDAGYTRRGIGTYLLEFALGQAVIFGRDSGCRFLVADVNAADQGALAMYVNFGFEPCTHVKYESGARRGQPRYFYDLHTNPPVT